MNHPDEGRCVDLFIRPDGSFGYEEFRRDFEDNRSWYPIGFFGQRIYENKDDAWLEALQNVPWLRTVDQF